MRRKDREVTDPREIAGIMSRCEVLHLAINTEAAPYLLPVNFGMEPDGMTLYIHGAVTGRKYDLLEQDNRVGIQMECTHGLVLNPEDHSCSMDYESVIGWGIAEEVTGEAEKTHALKLLMAHYRGEDFPVDLSPMPHTRVLKVRVMERSCKRRKKRV